MEGRSEEDEIISMLQETQASNYCDGVFPAAEESLYRNTQFVPGYDGPAAPGPERWVRPGDFARDPDYFKDLASLVVPGRMNDLWLVGAMAAVCRHALRLASREVAIDTLDFGEGGAWKREDDPEI